MTLAPYVRDPDFTLYHGDVRQVLPQLEAGSVDCALTSPPYWGLRDYGADGQLGLEATPEAYVEALVGVFRDVRRLLKPEGTLWLNLGDSYASDAAKGGSGTPNGRNGRGENYARPGLGGLKPKDLVGIPWRVAFALQADGWYLRSDIIWAKPNPMPESVTDRPTKSHEYVFLLAKSARYFFDDDAVREAFAEGHNGRMGPATAGRTQEGGFKRVPGAPLASLPQRETLDGSDGESPRGHDGRRATAVLGRDGSLQHRDGERWPNDGRNVRSVWEIATQPFAEAHFATWPEVLVERCIKAGCPEGGTVLDPFMGSGTTALVARRLGRNAVGVELNAEYAAMCARRLGQQSLLAEGAA